VRPSFLDKAVDLVTELLGDALVSKARQAEVELRLRDTEYAVSSFDNIAPGSGRREERALPFRGAEPGFIRGF
jgi:hypothetical protein